MRLIFFVVLCFSLSACAVSPLGRKQLTLVDDVQMDQMGVAAFSETKKKEKVQTDSKTKAYVDCIVRALTAEVDRQNWELVVFDDRENANAFALPGGKIGVYTGLFSVAKNQDQLAAVIGHEIGHVIARHGNERVSTGLVAQIGAEAVSSVLTKKDSPQYSLLMGALGLGAQYGVVLPYGRTQESEADLIGLDLMAKAGFNPEGAVDLWKNMQAASKGQPPEWASTHPSHQSRIQKLHQNMKVAKEVEAAAHRSQKNPNCL